MHFTPTSHLPHASPPAAANSTVALFGRSTEAERAPAAHLFTSHGGLGASGEDRKNRPVCRHWQRGHCQRGDACGFAHPPAEFGVAGKSDKVKEVCRHWKRGHCNLGDSCNFSHPEGLRGTAQHPPRTAGMTAVMSSSHTTPTNSPHMLGSGVNLGIDTSGAPLTLSQSQLQALSGLSSGNIPSGMLAAAAAAAGSRSMPTSVGVPGVTQVGYSVVPNSGTLMAHEFVIDSNTGGLRSISAATMPPTTTTPPSTPAAATTAQMQQQSRMSGGRRQMADCRHWLRKGYCWRKDTCHFKHDDDKRGIEMPTPTQQPTYASAEAVVDTPIPSFAVQPPPQTQVHVEDSPVDVETPTQPLPTRAVMKRASIAHIPSQLGTGFGTGNNLDVAKEMVKQIRRASIAVCIERLEDSPSPQVAENFVSLVAEDPEDSEEFLNEYYSTARRDTVRTELGLYRE